jgi:peptidoglycan hydrolase-like protein with peptidoglycan-binding domain
MRRTLPVLAAAALSLTLTAEAFSARYASRTLRMGASGSDVRALQEYLDDAGYETLADGEFGPATRRSLMSFETAEGTRADGAASRGEQRLVEERAATAALEAEAEAEAEAPEEPLEVASEEATLGEDGLAIAPASAPEEVKAIIAAGNEIATKPYKYGGGHGRGFDDRGYDCSGSVSYVLHAAGLLDTPLDSSGLMDWGERGRGQWITVRSNPGHAYLIVAGLRFDTSARRQTGNRWSDEMRAARGYAGRHPAGL